NQKSFRLYARKEYDEKNEFEYPFLTGLLSRKDGTLAQKYKRLAVRSSGTDNGCGYIRSELCCALAAEAGFPDVMYAAPVCVYINGNYQGIYWLENGYDRQYFENRYGEYDGEFIAIDGSDKYKEASEDAEIQPYVTEFNELYLGFSEKDLTVQENYEDLRQFIDVENYLQYFAIEYYVGNMDWPGNNLKVYRYVSQNNDYEEGTVFDGRYRYLLYDLDYSFGLNDMLGVLTGVPSLERIMGEDTPLFAALMEREDCRQYFINYMCDLMNGAMSAENIEKTLQKMHSSRQGELYYMLEEAGMPEEAIWNWESAPRNYETVEAHYNKIVEFAAMRPAAVLNDIISQFGGSQEELYALHILNGDTFSTVEVNSIHVQDEGFSGIYFANVPVTVKPCLAVNEVFDYWIVNGSIREEEELQLSQGDVQDKEIRVELVVHEKEEPVLAINKVRAKGKSDFIELVNLSNKPVSTLGYFLSDGEDPYKYAIPVMTMQPGETRRFYGRNCMDSGGLGQIGLNFNLKRDETVTLTYGSQVVETLLIPDMTDGGIYTRDGNTGKFIEVLGGEE
ncbi:MAG: CotH kinase family protein, partial [Butyrivibrio sp.]|nr:CotH kinase family protein [Butyrivibrio sp.]